MLLYKTFLLALLFSASLYPASNTPSEECAKIPELITPLARRQIPSSTKEEIETAYNNWQHNKDLCEAERIPNEIWEEHVFPHLNKEDLDSLGLVSRRFRNLWVTCRRLFPVLLDDSLRRHIIAPTTCPYAVLNLCSIKLNRLNPTDFAILSHLRFLRKIRIEGVESPLGMIQKLSQSLQEDPQSPVLNCSQLEITEGYLPPLCAQAIAQGLAGNTTLKEVTLTHNRINQEGGLALAGVLRTNTVLTSFNLANNEMGYLPASDIGQALQTNSTLKKLNLRANHIDPQVAPTLALALQTNRTLTHLSLGINRINAQGCATLMRALKGNTALISLGLERNQIRETNDLTLAIQEFFNANNTLEKLFLSDNQIGFNAAEAIAEGLKTNTGLLELDLASNELTHEIGTPLAIALKANNTLKRLNLGHNKLGNPGTLALASGLQENKTLEKMGLHLNQIGDDGAEALAKVLGISTSLKTLDLEQNEIGPKGLKAIINAFEYQNPLLKKAFETIKSAIKM